MNEQNSKKKELLKVEEIHKLFIGLEQESRDGQFDLQFLGELIQQIGELEQFEDPLLKKLSKYKDSLKPEMTLRHLATIAVPFERYLKKGMADDEFMIMNTDRDHLVTPRVPLHFILDNMRSAFNVGSVFRTADSLGAQKLWLTGYTPTPHQPQVERAALGAAFILEWEQKNFKVCIENLMKQNFKIIALETTSHAQSIYEDFTVTQPTAFVLGNERFGLDRDQIELCHEVRKIPCYGLKNSLNASVAAAIAGYEWRKQYAEIQYHD